MENRAGRDPKALKSSAKSPKAPDKVQSGSVVVSYRLPQASSEHAPEAGTILRGPSKFTFQKKREKKT